MLMQVLRLGINVYWAKVTDVEVCAVFLIHLAVLICSQNELILVTLIHGGSVRAE